MRKEEFLQLIDVLDQLRAHGEAGLPLIEPDPVWNMTLFLMKQHLRGRLVTPTSLAKSAGVPYTTAVRRVEDMIAAGLILRRPRTRSGLTFSIHPSRELVRRTYAFAQDTRVLLAGAFSTSQEGVDAGPARRVIPGPTVLPGGLGYRRTLKILLYNDPSFFVADDLKREISYLLGGKVEIAGHVLDELRSVTLANAARAMSQYDIVAVDLPWIGEYATRGVLMPLDEIIAVGKFQPADFHAAEWDAGRFDGNQLGVPLQTNAEILMVRRDMLRTEGQAVPGSTDELIEAARRLHRPGTGRYGVAWAGAEGSPIAHAFMHFLADFGQPLLNLRRRSGGYDANRVAGEAFRPTIDTSNGRLAAEFMRELLAVSPPDVLAMSWREQIAMFAAGQAAFSYSWSVRAARFELDRSSPASGNTGFHPRPVGSSPTQRRKPPISPIGGFVLGIPANIDPERMDLAGRALEWLTSPELMKLFVEHGGLVTPRFSVASDFEVRQLSPVIDAVDRMAKQDGLQLWPRPPVAEYAEIVAILGREIHSMLRGDTSIATALARSQAEIDALMRSHGRYS